jgi:methionyl-tRNA synthetase
VLTFVYRNFDGKVPEHGGLTESDKALMQAADTCLEQSGELLSNCKFKQAITNIMATTRDVNRYLDDKAPWKLIKEDRQAAADSLYVALYAISCLKTSFYPFLPFSSQKVHEYLGFDGRVENNGWQPHTPRPGQRLGEPKPLFTKLDEGIIQEETSRIGT